MFQSEQELPLDRSLYIDSSLCSVVNVMTKNELKLNYLQICSCFGSDTKGGVSLILRSKHLYFAMQ